MKVFVIQMGARRQYELAQMLEQQQSLAALQTGAAWPEGKTPPPLLMKLMPDKHSAFRRRTVRDIPAGKVRTTLLPELAGRVARRLGADPFTYHAIEDRVLGTVARVNGLAGADTVLSTGGNGGERFLAWAKDRGLRIAIDVYIHPRADRIVADNMGAWLKDDPAVTRRRIERVEARWSRLFALADRLLCPSSFVADGVRELAPDAASKIRSVPYSLGGYSLEKGTPRPRRVLFSGSDAIRKGLPALAATSDILTPLGYEFRIAGQIPVDNTKNVAFASLTFLGHLGADDMRQEFLAADVFCLPSLAEGMARVTLEAMACGVPCVVTPGAGAPVRDGVEGCVVPQGDTASLAEAIRSISENRSKREAMSDAAVAKAKAHVPGETVKNLRNALASD